MGSCDNSCINCFWLFFVWLCRFWGLVTALGLWGIGVEAAFYGHTLGYVILAVAVLVTFLEVVFVINMCVILCVSDTSSCCMTIWRCILWLDDWKKGIVYVGFSVPCFIKPDEVWMGIISGVMLVISSIFYIIKTFRSQQDDAAEKLSPNATYDRFEDLQDDLQDDIDEAIMNPSDTAPIMSVANQSEILEL